MVSAGKDHTCALDEEGVKCWGGVAELIPPPMNGDRKTE
ncbi:MAG: RCC1-like domain-containing protein [Pseudomonadota bacterium]